MLLPRLPDRRSRAFKLFAVLLPGRTQAALLVVAVLGVLAALAAFAYQSFVDDSRAEAVSYDGGWETLTAAVPTPYPRDDLLTGATDAKGRIYAIGGISSAGSRVSTVERLGLLPSRRHSLGSVGCRDLTGCVPF